MLTMEWDVGSTVSTRYTLHKNIETGDLSALYIWVDVISVCHNPDL